MKKLINCTTCGNEIALSAKRCPSCGAKNKKPIYKRVSFWVIAVFLGIGISANMATTETTPTTSPSATNASVSTNSSSNTPSEPQATMGEKNALRAAKNHTKIMAFSRDGLITQLTFEGFSTEEATYGVDNCGADWNEQAAKKAKSYLDIMSYSKDGLIHQLKFEGFTDEQALYGVEANGY